MIFNSDIVSDIFIKLKKQCFCGRKRFEIIGVYFKANYRKSKRHSNENKRNFVKKQGKTSDNSR